MTTETTKRERLISFTHDHAAGKSYCDIKGQGRLTLDHAAMSAANRLAFFEHGIEARLRDAAALPNGATPADKLAAVQTLTQHYNSGSEDWSPARGAAKEGPSLALRAFAAVKGIGVEEAKAKVAEQAKAKGVTEKVLLDKLAGVEAIRAKMDELRPKAADADQLFDELMEG